MKVKMNATISGTRNGEPWPPHGSVVDLPEGEARDLLSSGVAVPAPDDVPVEKVETAPEPEAAIAPVAETPEVAPAEVSAPVAPETATPKKTTAARRSSGKG